MSQIMAKVCVEIFAWFGELKNIYVKTYQEISWGIRILQGLGTYNNYTYTNPRILVYVDMYVP